MCISRRYTFTILLVLLVCLLADCQSLKIAAASNTQFAIKEIIAEFEKRESIEVDLILGSSGKLVAQIANGAPYHIFLSANMGYVNHLYLEGHAISKPKIYVTGSAVLWTLNDEIDISDGLHSLLQDNIKTIAIASPKNAPYGILAKNALVNAQLYERVKNKLVFGSSISQVNQYITLGTSDIGITSQSIVMSPPIKGMGRWIEVNNHIVDQGMVKLKYSREHNKEETNLFYDFLQSTKTKDIFIKHGYIVK